MVLLNKLKLLSPLANLTPCIKISPITRAISTTSRLDYIRKETRMRVVDNSALGKQAMLEGKPPKVIHVYRKTGYGEVGNKVMVAIKGQKRKGVIVGMKLRQNVFVPRYDSNNVVLIDDKGNPIGNRILVPIPNLLRNPKFGWNKLVSIATKFA